MSLEQLNGGAHHGLSGYPGAMMGASSSMAGGAVAAMPHVDGVTHRWIKVRGLHLHVAETVVDDPTAPVLVLLHGWP